MLRKTLTTLLLSGCALGAMAVPAKPGILSYPQPDGTRISIKLHGDEFGSWYESADGYVLIPNASGALEYATLSSGKLVTTGVRAMEPDMRPAAHKSLLASLPLGQIREVAMKQQFDASVKARAPRKVQTGGLINNYPKTGSPKAMVLLVEFQDVKFSVDNPQQAFTRQLTEKGYSVNGATGSALDYFTDQSKGTFTPQFDVFGPVTVPNNESFYGAESGLSHDVQAWKMVQHACDELHKQNPELDWSEYDNDGDGYVDNIFLYYAGYGENHGAPSWTIWPHAANLYTFYGIVQEFNGVRVGSYACSNELQGTSGVAIEGIGTFCHEYSHVLGLPDYYPTNGSNAYTPGAFEIMDSGSYNNNSNTPPNYSAFSRFCLGWLNPRELTGPENVTLNPMPESGEALLITTDKDEEYFVLENRQRNGWDAHLPGHGMLVWHIDFDANSWIGNKPNNDASHQRIDLVEADNIKSDSSRSGDPFPGTGNVRQFTRTSTPAMSCWSGYELDMPITDIYEADGVITFKVKGGGEVLTPVNATEASDVTPLSFTANWQAGVGVHEYEVDVCQAPLLVPFMTLKVTGKTSVAVSGLNPDTDYTYVVRAVSGDRKSVDSNRVSVKTLPPTFEQKEMTALEADDVTNSAFTARWNELEGAEGYHLTAFYKQPVNPDYQTVDFTKDADGNLLPAGWTTSSTTTGSLKGYYGEATPALRLSNSGDRITTPTFDTDINSISLWYRGNSTGDDSSISIEGLQNGKWQTIYTVAPVDKTAGHTLTIGADSEVRMPQGVKAVRIAFYKEASGSLYIDDIVIGYGATYNVMHLDGFNDADQGTATSTRIDNLNPETTYYYTVRARDAQGLYTPQSAEIMVTTLPKGVSVAGVEADSSYIVARQGAIEVHAPAGTRIKVYDMAGRLEATATVGISGIVTIPAAPGMHTVAPMGKVVNVVR